MQMTAVTYDEMRPGCYDRDARIKDFELNWVDGSLPFPTFPRFCGQTFYEGEDKELGLACVRAYNDWMVEEWCEPSGGYNIPLCLIPLWDVELAAAGDAAQRRAGRAGHLLQRAAPPPEAAHDPHRLLGPAVPGVQRQRRHGLHAHRVVVDQPGGVARRARRRGRDAGVQQLHGVAGRLAVLGQADRVPEAEAGLLRGPDRLDPLRARAGRHGLGAPRQLAALEGHASPSRRRPTTTGASSAASPPTTTACTTSTRSAADNICFETDYPHTDTTWPDSKEYAEKMLADFDDEIAYKVLRGNAIKMLELDRVYTAAGSINPSRGPPSTRSASSSWASLPPRACRARCCWS